MSVLSDRTLTEMIIQSGMKKGKVDREKIIGITPYVLENIQAASVDLTLSDHFLMPEIGLTSVLDFEEPIEYTEFHKSEFTIPPKAFVLGSTVESVRVPDHICAFVSGRSSIGRLGLFTENAGWIDPGWEGRITLELYNANAFPIRVRAGRRICQIIFQTLDNPAMKPYRGKYHGSKRTIGSQVSKDRENG